MESQSAEFKRMKPFETTQVELVSRGALGLQLFYRTDQDSIVQVTRLEPKLNSTNSILPGDPLSAIFEIKSLKKGIVNITFYETQPWNKDFAEIIQKKIQVEVAD
ncbi:MAG: protease inhibitor I42 family protein [Mariniphaga sp.]